MKRNPLFFTRRFLPLYLVQFFGAFNDNLYRNALVILIVYRLSEEQGFDSTVYIPLSAGIFLLPFFLFSANAGIIADKLEKSSLVVYIKFAEIIIMSAGVIAFYLAVIPFMMAVLFVMGLQSALFGPLKYSLLPFFLKEEELVRGNALINTATFAAILLGTIGGSWLVLENNGLLIVSVALITFAVLGWMPSLFIPKIGNTSEKLTLPEIFNFVKYTFRICRLGTANPAIKQTLYGVSWFWFIGGTFLSQLLTLVNVSLHADNTVYMGFLGLFVIGIALGAFFCSRFVRKPTIKLVFPMITALTVLMLLYYPFYLFIPDLSGTPEKLNLIEIFSIPAIYPFAVLLLLTAAAGGIYIIPQFALTQALSNPNERSQVIAVNNILNALFMVMASLIIMVLNAFMPVPMTFGVMGLLNIPFYLYWKGINKK